MDAIEIAVYIMQLVQSSFNIYRYRALGAFEANQLDDHCISCCDSPNVDFHYVFIDGFLFSLHMYQLFYCILFVLIFLT
jgi:hypothetical protein